MNIAIQAADLDARRIDGTRVYLLRLLERFGAIMPEKKWHIYHRRDFNPDLVPPKFPNYSFRAVSFPFFWTQTRFSWEIFQFRPERVFMPVQALPLFLPKGTESVVTIHDLAFKIFPEHFPSRDLRRLNWFTDFAVQRATRLIAVSESTKQDILKYYSSVSEEKIRVIHHGFDSELEGISKKEYEKKSVVERFKLVPKEYLLYVGAIQPRKNLRRLLDAFRIFGEKHPLAKLVLAGEAAWLSDDIFRTYKEHPFRERILFPGRVSFAERSALYANARAFVFPSLYEGFGLPILEAFAANVPVVCANNSSLPEVAGDAALFFDATKTDELVNTILDLWEDETKQNALIAKGREQLKKFSWDICAQETAEWIVR